MADTTSSEDVELVEYMLTTVDNPFDPFTQFDQWLAEDMALGYDTPGYLARITTSSDDLSDVDQFLAIQEAIDTIVTENIFGVHRKVKRGQLAQMNNE
jgi:hypothetical protein